jgi:hypothetical protein
MSAAFLSRPPERRRFGPMRLGPMRFQPIRFGLVALAVLATAGLAHFGVSEGGLRAELSAAAGELRSLPPDTPTARVEQIVARDFVGRNVAVDADRFPDLVLVTLSGLDRSACLAAETRARRIEGLVVTELAGHRTPAECGPSNDMTWRIMP